MSVDFRELEQFRDKIRQIGEHGASELCDDCTKELAARLLRKVIKRTPVGKIPEEYCGKEGRKKRRETVKSTSENGKTRKFLSADAARYQEYWAGYVGGTLRRGWTGDQKINVSQYVNGIPINVMSNNHRIMIVNQVKYAAYVEYGHRQQPGRYVPALGKRLKSSWVPGRFMLRNSEVELDATAQRIVDKKVQQYLQREFGHE